MAVASVREFECILCRRQFSMLTQDLIPPWTLICHECMEEILELEEKALAEYLAAAYATAYPWQPPGPANGPARPHPFEKQIMAHVRSVRQRREASPGSDSQP
jgi:hypothetical protein